MNQKNITGWVGGFILVIGLGYYFSSHRVNDTMSFDDINVQPDKTALEDGFGDYITLPTITADEDAVADLVGAILIRSRTGTNDVWSYELRFRPARDRIKAKIVDEQLFHGIVSAKADFGGRFKIASGDVSAEDLAETSIRNQMVVGFKDQADIPFQELSQLKLSPEREYFFAERVIVTDITTRRFQKHSGKGKIEGLAFGANGSVYSERDAVRSQKFVSFRPTDLLGLQPSEAGNRSRLMDLAGEARIRRLSEFEASELVELLAKKAILHGPISVSIENPPAGLPGTIGQMKPQVWLKTLRPVRQSTPNRCWAATTALLFTWQKGRQIKESEAVTSLGPMWEAFYKKDAPLPKSYKLDFLKAADFNYKAPQSYTPQGLIDLLKENGPVWFTIDKEFGRHATVLTGVFLNSAETEYWLTYIDPSDGELKGDTYSAFMRRYEAPAFRENAENQSVIEIEGDLDIQIIHL